MRVCVWGGGGGERGDVCYFSLTFVSCGMHVLLYLSWCYFHSAFFAWLLVRGDFKPSLLLLLADSFVSMLPRNVRLNGLLRETAHSAFLQ